MIRTEAQPGVVVQARGFPRNRLWIVHYHLYPLRVIGKPQETGGLPNDPVDPRAQWVVSWGRTLMVNRVQ